MCISFYAMLSNGRLYSVTWHMPHIPKQGGRVRNRSKHFIQWGNVRFFSFKVGRGGSKDYYEFGRKKWGKARKGEEAVGYISPLSIPMTNITMNIHAYPIVG